MMFILIETAKLGEKDINTITVPCLKQRKIEGYKYFMQTGGEGMEGGREIQTDREQQSLANILLYIVNNHPHHMSVCTS